MGQTYKRLVINMRDNPSLLTSLSSGSLLNGINGKKMFFVFVFLGLPSVFYFNFFTVSVL